MCKIYINIKTRDYQFQVQLLLYVFSSKNESKHHYAQIGAKEK